MPTTCGVRGCNSVFTKDRTSFHKVPDSRLFPHIRQQWLWAIGRSPDEVRSSTKVCGKHFTPDDYEIGGFKKILKKTAIPTIKVHHKIDQKSGNPVTAPVPYVAPVISYQISGQTYTIVLPHTPVISVGTSNPFEQQIAEVKNSIQPNQNPSLVKEDSAMHESESEEDSHGVEFKPEMWEDDGKKFKEDMTENRPKTKATKCTSNGDVYIKSEVIPCCALACTNTSESFIMNCLPRDQALRQVWVEKIDRLDWTPEPDSALCEIHFGPEMWDSDVGEEKILRNDAVPTMFLHGEAIKSWVTMDNTGNVENIVVGSEDNHEDDVEEEMEEDDEGNDSGSEREDYGEVLEPEIDMVEGSEDVLSQEASSTEDFETIYCDTTVNDEQDGYIFSKEEPDTILPEQDEEITCLDNSSGNENGDHNRDGSGPWMKAADKTMFNKFNFKKRLKRRSSCQLPGDFQCPICDRRLSRRKNLELHIEKLHPNGEMSEYQKKRKQEELRAKEEEAIRLQKERLFKKPPPALRPIVPQCLMTPTASKIVAQPAFPVVSSTTLPTSLVASSATPSATSLVATTSNGSSILSPSAVSTPSILEKTLTSPEPRKQFLLLLPKPPVRPEQPASSTDDSEVFSVNLSHVPLDKRIMLKAKLREFIDAVVTKNLNPNKIIIAYDRT